MKTRFLSLIIGALAVAGLSGCAHFKEASATKHKQEHHAAVVPPGWSVYATELTNSATGNALVEYTFTAPGTNQGGFFANLTAPRPRIYTDWEESWTDQSGGGGTFVFTDPTASNMQFSHTNQAGLGGSRTTSIGQIQSTITTNAVAAINAGGTAVGNVIGAAAGAAAGK